MNISNNYICSWEKASLGGCHWRNSYQAEESIYLAIQGLDICSLLLLPFWYIYTKVTPLTEISQLFSFGNGFDNI